jgi:hypothetical protein
MCQRKRAGLALLALAGVLALSSCAAIDEMAAALANLQRLKFKLSGVRDFRLLGIDIGGKARLGDFSALDAVKLVQSYTSRKLPVDFVVDVLAVNPNDGTGGTRQTTSTLTGLECRLLIDGQPTVVGNIDGPSRSRHGPGVGHPDPALARSPGVLRRPTIRRHPNWPWRSAEGTGRRRASLDAQPTVSTPAGRSPIPAGYDHQHRISVS